MDSQTCVYMYVRFPVVGRVDNTCVVGSGWPCVRGSGRPCVSGSGRPSVGGSRQPCVCHTCTYDIIYN